MNVGMNPNKEDEQDVEETGGQRPGRRERAEFSFVPPQNFSTVEQ